ncbi:MAG: type II toxin-antitoxin system prevent-host-death family antitoxin [Intestinimonas sp.]|jgi:prevent-host-death family protein|nr:type II toxin-antitoxin system prevent-host-death family antitoxin [Intestinimonas sp.]
MKLDLDTIIPISKVNQNFSQAAREAEKHESIIIMKNSKPKFVLMTFEKYEELERKSNQDAQ